MDLCQTQIASEHLTLDCLPFHPGEHLFVLPVGKQYKNRGEKNCSSMGKFHDLIPLTNESLLRDCILNGYRTDRDFKHENLICVMYEKRNRSIADEFWLTQGELLEACIEREIDADRSLDVKGLKELLIPWHNHARFLRDTEFQCQIVLLCKDEVEVIKMLIKIDTHSLSIISSIGIR